MNAAVAALPAGFRIALDPATRRVDDGATLIGGFPLRIVRLSPAGRRLVDRWAGGAPVDQAGGAQRLARRLLDAGLAHPRPAGAPPPWAPADVAAVVPIHGDARDLDRTLSTLGPVGETLVVDDASPDAGAIAAVAAVHGARLLRLDRNVGPAAARQVGWQASTRPVVAFVDADVEPADGWLGPLLAHLADPRVGAVAPRVVPVARPGTPAGLAAYEARRSSLDLGPFESPVRPRARVPYVPTAALVVRRDALEAVGGFDESLRVGEDVDLVWRLDRAGWVVRYEPSARARHPMRATWSAWARQRYRYGTSAPALARRHGGAVAPLTVSGWSAAAWALVVAGSPAAGVAVGAGTTAALVPKLRSLRHPVAEALRLAGLGNLFAGRQVADALRRPWWPLTLALFLGWRRARPALVAAAVVPALVEHREARPDLGIAAFTALRLADDVAYGTGVWAGCITRRDLTALLPAFAGRFPPPDDDDTGEDHEGRQGNPPRLPGLVPRPGEGRQPVR
ncbi:MAG TPA: mycofactocin biosynthesis glycosyltransferase MftF [Acidimicrobiales bacterium]|nr:mycofactocin biosynthesis glycosyltransferase MftF [Acidimicrobiales bacterium]